MTTTTPPPVDGMQTLMDRLGPAVSEHVRGNPLLTLVGDRRLTIEHLRLFVRSELAAQPAEVAAFAQLTLRTPPGSRQQGLFLGVLTALAGARPALLAAADALGLRADEVGDIPEGAARFAEFVSWTGFNAEPGAAAAMLRSDLMLWCAVCAKLISVLGSDTVPAVPEPVRAYIAAYAQTPADTIRIAEEVIVAATEAGESAAEIARVAARVEPVLNAYWQSVAAS